MSGLRSVEDHGALVDSIDISDLTSDEVNARILRKLKNDDPYLDELRVGDAVGRGIVVGAPNVRQTYHYAIEDARGMGVLGYYLGKSTHVTDLHFASGRSEVDRSVMQPFFGGLASNRSIQKVYVENSLIPCDFSRMLTPFIKANPNLTEFIVQRCEMDADQYRSLSSALREGRSLKYFMLRDLIGGDQYDHEESTIEHIEALKMHPHLTELHFRGFDMRRNASVALSDLLRQSGGMQKVVLWNNGIDDAGIEALVDGIAHCRSLREFYLPENRSITADGWRALLAVLKDPNSGLKRLHIWGNGIKDEIATIFANGLARNNTLELLNLHSCVESTRLAPIFGESTGEGWKAFSKLLCDTSSVSSTFLSNHTLQYLTAPGKSDVPDDLARIESHLPYDIRSSLTLNRESDKKEVAMKKILLHHGEFDMQPLFEWDLKVLPFVIGWFERAAAYEIEYEADNRKRKLSAIYQFIRGMPELAIDGITGVNKRSTKMGGVKRPYSDACE